MTDFKLYPQQKTALMTDSNEILYGGAVGGGKSYLARVATIVYSLEVPGLITYLFRRTFKEVLANHVHTPGGYLEMLHQLIEDGDVVFSKSDYSFTFFNGSRIQLAHSQYESDIYTHQGAQIGFLVIDEATHFTPEMIRFIRSRVRLGSLKVPPQWKGLFPRILYTANPGGVGHHYFKSNFVDVASRGKWVAPEDEGSMRRQYIPAKLTDNKVLMETDPDYLQRVKGMGSASIVKAMIDGDWDILSSGGFADLWRPATHIVEPFDIPSTWIVDRGYDYGSSAPAAGLVFAESDGTEFINNQGVLCWVPKGTLFIIGEIYFANAKHEGLRLPAEEQARRIKAYEDDNGWDVQPGPADTAIFTREPGRPSISDDMAKYVKYTRGDKSPGSRVQGVGLMRQRLQASLNRPMEGPGLYVFNNCTHTIRTLPVLENDDKHLEDIATQGEDHIWDVIRYKLLSYVKRLSTIGVSGA